jgi:GWxTD domain-containing protein
MLMKVRLLALFSLLLLPSGVLPVATVHAQTVLEADAAGFRLDSVADQVQVYYGVLQRVLKFEQKGSAWEAPFNARVELWQNGKTVDKRDIQQVIRYECTKEQLDSIGANMLFGAAAFRTPPSANTIAAFIWQRGSSNVADTIRSEQLELPKTRSNQIEVGGIELGSSIAPANGQASPLERIGYILTPNPSSIYGENYTKLYYYTEIYVPASMISADQSVTVTTRIIDPSGKQLLAKSEKQMLAGATIPLIIGLDIDGLPQDRYRLQVQVKLDDGVVAEREKPFFFVSGMKLSDEAPASAATSTSNDELFAGSQFASMTEASADELIAQSNYLASEAERKMSLKLSSVDAKRRYLFNFWMNRDASGDRPLSAFAVYQQRLRFVSEKYSYQKTPGWKTSRGRVYLIYGPNVYIDEHLFDPDTKPYVTWGYDPDPRIRLNSGNRPEFVFIDRQGGGNFVLVHSNVVGEVSEPDWYSRDARRLSH